MSDLRRAMLSEAREYLSGAFTVDLSDLSDDLTRSTMDGTYPGGWSNFERRFMTDYRPTAATAFSPMQVKARVQHFLGRQVREYDEILHADFSDTEVVISISFATVDRLTRRDKVTARTYELHRFTRDAGSLSWAHESVTVDQAVAEAFVRYGAVNTPDRHAATTEQVETCYRPGSERSPMQGWVARLEVSHAQAHATERFQMPLPGAPRD